MEGHGTTGPVWWGEGDEPPALLADRPPSDEDAPEHRREPREDAPAAPAARPRVWVVIEDHEDGEGPVAAVFATKAGAQEELRTFVDWWGGDLQDTMEVTDEYGVATAWALEQEVIP